MRIRSPSAIVTLATLENAGNKHPVALFELRYSRAHILDDTDTLMPRDVAQYTPWNVTFEDMQVRAAIVVLVILTSASVAARTAEIGLSMSAF